MKHNVATLLGVVGVTTATTLLGVGEASAIVLDNFNTDHDVLAGGTDTISNSNIFGGVRKVDMNGASADSRTLSGDSGSANDRLVFNVDDSTTTAQTLTLRYDGNSADATTLVENGISATDFGRGVLFKDVSGNARIDVSLFSGVGNEGTAASTFTFTRTLAEDIFLSFEDDFTFGGSFNEKTVTAAQFSITELDQGGTNPRLSSFETVPEAVPFEAETSAALLLLGSWGAWKYWRKRNQSKIQLTASDEN